MQAFAQTGDGGHRLVELCLLVLVEIDLDDAPTPLRRSRSGTPDIHVLPRHTGPKAGLRPAGRACLAVGFAIWMADAAGA